MAAFVLVELQGVVRTPAPGGLAGLHKVDGAIRRQLRGHRRVRLGPYEGHDGVLCEVVRGLSGDDTHPLVVVAPEGYRLRFASVQLRMDAHDGPELRKVVATFVVLTEQAVQCLGNGPSDRSEQQAAAMHHARKLCGDAQLLAAGEDRRGDDLPEHEHERHREDHGHPGGHDLVKEQWQGLVGYGVHEQQGDQQPVVVLDEGQDPGGSKLVGLELLPFLHVLDVLLLRVHDDLHLHGLQGDEAHGEAGGQGREDHTGKGQEAVLDEACAPHGQLLALQLLWDRGQEGFELRDPQGQPRALRPALPQRGELCLLGRRRRPAASNAEQQRRRGHGGRQPRPVHHAAPALCPGCPPPLPSSLRCP
mmetsp:Transcript_88624/g.275764  ORF Transcript_88624/g.275764 Transcript_88624/m.275764 type:complete len:362 (-) Transcript_88624:2-1087(-)